MSYSFSLPAYYGQGIRSCLVMTFQAWQHVSISGKMGRMNYFDREEIGSGLDLISTSHKTDISLQIVWNNL
ncbi:hypothetical protein [Aquirufa rosea]|uniref:Uncharacterized protein n=1 Tax=Aquirufa rosea TaxID=2509241 RepID=A0A4Q1BXK8_9BACT|nr:hypothetical protein [Aquirufa rosea]RXK47140.1 hypothetical protein ESB04_11110 [Aquirufa rosea]